MTKCFRDYGSSKLFGYKRNENNKTYTGKFTLRDYGDRFEIWDLGVVGKYRNKGYATQMLTEFLSQFHLDKPLFLYVYINLHHNIVL